MDVVEKQTGYFSSHDGCSIYFEKRGQGDPIIFVYGIACLMNHWHFQVDHFVKTHQVITFDLRGHHKSEAPADPAGLTIQAVALDILALMNHLQIEKAHLVGHSFGTPVLLSCVDQFPDRIKSLSFINGFAQNPIKGMFGLDFIEPLFYFIKKNFLANPSLWTQVWKTAVHNPLSTWLSAFAGGFNIKLTQFKDIEIYTKGVAQIPLDVFLPMFEDMMNFDGYGIARKIEVPSLLIAGDRDFVTPMKFQEELHNSIRQSELVIVPYGSHCSQLDFPDYINLKLEKLFSDS